MTLERRTPLRRTGIARGTTELARTGPPARRTPLAAESAKHRAERPARAAVRAAALDRDGATCTARDVWPEVECWGPLDVHEVIARSGWAAGYLVVENTRTICRGHHEAVGDRPELAAERGLRRHAWERSGSPDRGDQP